MLFLRSNYKIHLQHAWVLEFFKTHLVDSRNALDVGSGSGYMTAAMATMMGSAGRVTGIDHVPQLVERAYKNVGRGNPELLASGRVQFLGGYHGH